MPVFSNRGSGTTPTIVTNPSDETTDYPAGTPPALVNPRTYTAPGQSPWDINTQILGNGITGVTLQVGKPRILYEVKGANRGGYLHYAAVKSWGHSGNLISVAKLVGDTLENYVEGSVVMLSHDFGQTWTEANRYDINYRNNGPCAPRFYDSSDGKMHEWSQAWQPDPIGQFRDWKCHHSYYANSGHKRVTYPWGSTLRGLPADIGTVETGSPIAYPGTIMRHWWGDIASEGTVVTMADGAWAMVVDGRFNGDPNWCGFLVVSYDKGNTWTYRSKVGTGASSPNSGCSENALIRFSSGKLGCFARIYSHTHPSGPCKGWITTDTAGTSWTDAFYPSPTNFAVARMGPDAPTGITLTNGAHVIACARSGGSEIMSLSINRDGLDTDQAVWGWWDLTQHHNYYATDGDADDGGGDETNDYSTASGSTGKIQQFLATTVGGPATRVYSSSCYWGLAEIAPNEFFCVYDLTPSWRHPIGGNGATPFSHMHNYIYGVHCKLTLS